MTGWLLVRKAFISSLPVLMGYTTMGFAAGVLLAVHGGIRFSALWGGLTSAACISGALQFMLVDWIRTGTPLQDVALLTFCLNIRYAMYGLSLLERFKRIPLWQKLYLIWGLTDETYALEAECRIKNRDKNIFYCLVLSALNHSYWIIGVVSGCLAGEALPFPSKGIDFAMTALFIVILTDQCRVKANRVPALIGGVASLLALLVFGVEKMLIPSMILFIAVFLVLRPKFEHNNAEAQHE